ncbi:SRPBCC domain-containing protein [Agromyces rhizosphaerae]|nr:SRPBCC domain-containing protein [Agromyces rhizosphaerae]
MMTNPTGHYANRPDGLYLLFDRLFAAPIEKVWFTLTEPGEMKKWIGTYTGNPRTGGVRFILSGGANSEWEYASVLEFEAPHRFTADVGAGADEVRVYCHLTEKAGRTALTLGQRLRAPEDAQRIGPVWDHYLDALQSAIAGGERPKWSHYGDDYVEYYKGLVVPAESA